MPGEATSNTATTRWSTFRLIASRLDRVAYQSDSDRAAVAISVSARTAGGASKTAVPPPDSNPPGPVRSSVRMSASFSAAVTRP